VPSLALLAQAPTHLALPWKPGLLIAPMEERLSGRLPAAQQKGGQTQSTHNIVIWSRHSSAAAAQQEQLTLGASVF